LRQARLKSKKRTQSLHVSPRVEQRSKKTDESIKRLIKNSFEDYSKEALNLDLDSTFQDEIDEKLMNELSETEVDLKEVPSKEDTTDNDKPKFTPDEEFRLLQVYFKEMGTEPLLTPKEEVEVSAKIKKCEVKAAEAKMFIESIFEKSLTQSLQNTVSNVEKRTNSSIIKSSARNKKGSSANLKFDKAVAKKSIRRSSLLCKLYILRARLFKERFIKAILILLP